MEDKKIAAMLVLVRDEFNIIIDEYEKEQEKVFEIELHNVVIQPME